ncbi:hypothetical protein [Microbacterium schleiferi]|jgi:hypothetical protein|uniref:hypothetical protein n=1 Tax=Microbacterium schleiferi TaxID=69362 RepID=UPI000E80EDFA|nr:hypothetical protein [Microbacterium schleiferi]MCC4268065.1 hypothetical protein [Microbacterium schleiferi]HAS30843.1 hypothetical protein [Microbacterium sp.]|tara:strand:- start:4453 stop:4647 length:195 start_codon:yes stop_codon:yes gene_type:complete
MTKQPGEDPEVPLEDALEQDIDAGPGAADDRVATSVPLPEDADPIDAWEQRIETPLDDEDQREL